jgi:hypothetical protein
MQKKSSLFSMIILSLVLFSGFTPHPSRSSAKAPTKCDVFIVNNTAEVLTRISYVSSLDDVTWTNLPAFGGWNAGGLEFDYTTDDVNIYIYFSTVPRNAVATITYYGGVSTMNIVPGVNQFTFHAPFNTGGIVVSID